MSIKKTIRKTSRNVVLDSYLITAATIIITVSLVNYNIVIRVRADSL